MSKMLPKIILFLFPKKSEIATAGICISILKVKYKPFIIKTSDAVTFLVIV